MEPSWMLTFDAPSCPGCAVTNRTLSPSYVGKMLRSSASSFTVYDSGLLIAFTASVSRVLSRSTTSESTKSSSCQAVFSAAMWRLVDDGGETDAVVRRTIRRAHGVERRDGSQFERAVVRTRHVELDRQLNGALVDVRTNAGGGIGDVAVEVQHQRQCVGHRDERFIHHRDGASLPRSSR